MSINGLEMLKRNVNDIYDVILQKIEARFQFLKFSDFKNSIERHLTWIFDNAESAKTPKN